VTEGKRCERSVWRQKLRPEVCYVNDRHYAQDYGLIKEVQAVGARHVLRLCNNALSTPLEAPRALSAADHAAGVVADCLVRLGGGADGPTGRLVRVEADGHVFLLFTNLLEAPAELVALIYRHRWRVELFFKWLKCILGCRHWLAESPTGVMVQVYCALIASVLIVLWTGRKPTKRQWEALQLYWIGWAEVGDLERIFNPFVTTKSEGIGLGLAICRSIVQSHRGKLWASHNEGRGSTLHFTLPAQAKPSNPH